MSGERCPVHRLAGCQCGALAPIRERFPAAAAADFRAAYDGLLVTEYQQRILTWCENLDQPTLNALADVIRTARDSQ